MLEYASLVPLYSSDDEPFLLNDTLEPLKPALTTVGATINSPFAIPLGTVIDPVIEVAYVLDFPTYSLALFISLLKGNTVSAPPTSVL